MPAGPGEPLDPVIHTQARLRIMTTLTALPPGDRLTFPRLQALLDATAGNLSTHLRRLEDAGYVTVTKGHIGRLPATHVEATRAGRRAFEDYLARLAVLLTPPAGTAGPPSDGDATGRDAGAPLVLGAPGDAADRAPGTTSDRTPVHLGSEETR